MSDEGSVTGASNNVARKIPLSSNQTSE